MKEVCGFCRELHTSDKIRTFLGVDICNSCYMRMRRFIFDKADPTEVKEWIEKNMNWG